MVAHRALAHIGCSGDFAIVESVGHKARDLVFPIGETAERGGSLKGRGMKVRFGRRVHAGEAC